jgi:hypothetical protein
MKLAFTISYFGAAVHVGGEVEKETILVDVPDEQIPPPLQKYLDLKEKGTTSYTTLSISFVSEK